MERQTVSLRIEARELKRLDELCAQNGMERTTLINFAILSMLDYIEECGGIVPAEGESRLYDRGAARAGDDGGRSGAAAEHKQEGGC